MTRSYAYHSFWYNPLSIYKNELIKDTSNVVLININNGSTYNTTMLYTISPVLALFLIPNTAGNSIDNY